VAWKFLHARPRQVEEMGSRWSNIESCISGGRVKRVCLGHGGSEAGGGVGDEGCERSIAGVGISVEFGVAMWC